jgi:hypothetical protein
MERSSNSEESMQWYYSKNGTQLGPVAQGELISKLASGEVSPADLVWKDGMPDWVPASQVAELRQNMPAPPTPYPASPPTEAGSPYATPVAPAAPSYPVVAVVEPGKATTAMVLGIISVVTGLFCCLTGLPCGIFAVIFGNQFKKAAEFNPLLAQHAGKARGAVIMGWIGIGLSVLSGILGAVIQYAAQGQLPR